MSPLAGKPLPLAAEQQAAYNALTRLFEEHEQRETVVQIEVLPRAIVPPRGELILHDGSCIGMPKDVLVKAFLAAQKIYLDNARKASWCSTDQPGHVTENSERGEQVSLNRPLNNSSTHRNTFIRLSMSRLVASFIVGAFIHAVVVGAHL